MLKGSLEVLNLSDILQSLSQNKHTGTLVVTDGKREKLIYFSEGEIALFSSDKRLKIGELLVNAGKLAPEDLEFALTQQDNMASGASTQQLKLGEILVEEGFVTQDDITEIVKSQIEEEIYDLFLWKKADFEFLIDYCPDKLRRPSCNVTTLQFNTNSLIMEAARRLDEWDLITQEIPSLKEVYQPTPACADVVAALDVPKHVRDEVARVDGYHTIEQVSEQTALSKFELCRLLYELKNKGALAPLTPQQLSDRAEELSRQGRFRESAALYERLAEMLPKNLGIRRTYAEALRAFGDEKRALAQFELMAQQLEARRERAELARVLKSILEIEPDRKDIHEKLRELGRSGVGAGLARVAVSVALLTPLVVVVAAWILAPQDVRAVLGNLLRLAERKTAEPVADADEVDALKQLESGRELVAARRLEEAWVKLRDVVDRYPKTGAAKQVRLPIEVETDPPGKLVRLNGEPLGRTPLIVYYLPGERTLLLEIGDVDGPKWSSTLDPEVFHRVAVDFRRDPKWTFATGGPLRARPLVHRGIAYVPSLDGKLYGVRLSDQQVVLAASLEDGDGDPVGEAVSPAAASGDVVCVGTLDGSVLSFDLATGQRRKRIRVSEQPLLAGPATVGALVALSGYAGDVVLYDPAQNAPAKLQPLCANEVRADLTALQGTLFVASTDNRLLALEAADPKQLLAVRWQHDAGVDLVTPPCPHDEVVVLGDSAGELWCLAASTGAVRWSRRLGAPAVGIAAARGFALVSSADGKLACFDLKSGEPEWQTALDGRPSAPILAKRAVYVVTDKGTVHALDFLNKGASLWTGAVATAPASAPIIHDELLLFGGEDGRLYCFGLD